MKAETRIFGTIDIEDSKIIKMEKGMIGFPDLNNFSLIFNSEKHEKGGSTIMWLQSMDDGDIAFPVIIPNLIIEDYNPTVNNEVLAPLGNLNEENTYVLVTVNVPENLKAPIVLNTDTNKAAQIVVEDDFPVHFEFYDLLQKKKEKAGE